MANTMRIGTHGRSLARASIPSVARIHALMRIEGLVPVVDSSLAAQMAMAGVPVEPGTEVVDNPALAGIPVIMITGHSERNILQASLAAGAVDFVVKPFERERMHAKLAKFLHGRGPG